MVTRFEPGPRSGRPAGDARRPALTLCHHAVMHAPPGAPDAALAAARAVKAHGTDPAGTVWIHSAVSSAYLPTLREVWVYLPPGYDPSGLQHYPTVYVLDGNQRFGAPHGFHGATGGLEEIAAGQILAGTLPPMILVGIGNTIERTGEYTWHADAAGHGGKALAFARFLAEELKPFIDTVYLTRPGHWRTGVLGAGLGGLLALYLGAFAGDVFGRVAALAPALAWAERRALQDLATMRTDLRVWLDGEPLGLEPLDASLCRLDDARTLALLLGERGYQAGESLRFTEGPDDPHDGSAWALRAARALAFLAAE